MTLITIIKPAVEPVTDADLAVPARLDTTDFSEHINQFLVPTFRAEAEHRLGRRLITQTVELVLNDFPTADQPVDLQLPNVQSLVSVKYLDAAGTEQTLAPSAYTLDAVAAPGWVLPAAGTDWPAAGDYANAVRVRFVAGFGDASSVPAAVKAWMLLHIAEWYAQREAGADKPRDLLPHAARLLDRARQWWGRV